MTPKEAGRKRRRIGRDSGKLEIGLIVDGGGSEHGGPGRRRPRVATVVARRRRPVEHGRRSIGLADVFGAPRDVRAQT